MKRNYILWSIGIVLAVLLFVGAYFLYDYLSDNYKPDNLADSPADTEQQNVNTAPNFDAVDQNGKSVLLSDYFGKPIVLNFWASWCPPCKSEMPHFEAAFKKNPDIQFLMVNVTASDTMSDAKAFINKEGYTFPVLYDTSGEAAYIYNATSLPTTYFIDENGTIVTYAVGMLSAENLDKGLQMIK